MSAAWEAWPETWADLFSWQLLHRFLWKTSLFSPSLFLSQMGKGGKKDQGIVACKQLRAEELGDKHGSSLDTVTHPFVEPFILMLAPALLTLPATMSSPSF